MSWEHFSDDELRCKCGCSKMLMKDTFMQKVEAMRKAAGFVFHVNSGYRCPMYNAQVSSTGRSGPHTTGRAIDIGIDRERAYWVLTHASEFGITGIGVSQKGSSRFIHLDDLDGTAARPRPTVWSY